MKKSFSLASKAMATKYQDYIAAQVLSEGQPVNYRNVSRALKVNVSAAKRMLYEFHRIQSRRKPGSVHATYLVCGTTQSQGSYTNGARTAEDGDIEMQDSLPPSSVPEPSSSLPPSSMQEPPFDPLIEDVGVTTVTLVREEELDGVKQQYARIEALHVYSVEPGPIEHVQMLSDCTRRVVETQIQAREDPLETWKQYGTIHNPKAKRRAGARPPQPAAAPTPAVPMTAGMKSTGKPAPASAPAKKNDDSRPSSSGKESAREAKTSTPANLRRESSSLFKSFAKTRPPTQTNEQPRAEDEDIAEPSEDEESELAALPETNTEAREKAEADRKAKAEREATLKEMMEDDDEEEDQQNTKEDAQMQDPGEQDISAPDEVEKPRPEADNIKEVTTSGGRRRGRRRVVKKKHFKDAEGYMVTKEESAWESFSEDEAPPPSKKLATNTSSFKPTKDEKGKKGGKPGQGNIMNFFGKR